MWYYFEIKQFQLLYFHAQQFALVQTFSLSLFLSHAHANAVSLSVSHTHSNTRTHSNTLKHPHACGIQLPQFRYLASSRKKLEQRLATGTLRSVYIIMLWLKFELNPILRILFEVFWTDYSAIFLIHSKILKLAVFGVKQNITKINAK